MMWTLERLGLAYRKAKADSYFTDPPRRLDLAKYENNLWQNLVQLAKILKPYFAKSYAELPDELPRELVEFFELDDAWTVLTESFRYCDSDDQVGCAADLDSSGLIFAALWDEWNWHLNCSDEGQAKPVAEFRLMSDFDIYSYFVILMCSELSNIDYLTYLYGQIDALFVLKWNRDLNTLNALVESAALDVHCYVVQCNNRAYGDSRIRVPAKEDWARDLLLVKGSETDGFLMAEIDIHKLRDFQSHHESPNKEFKPVPEGFQLSEVRRVTPGGR